jgi:hypothetical protein
MARIGLVAVAVIAVAMFVLRGLRRRSFDVGSVSSNWVQQHRADAP